MSKQDIRHYSQNELVLQVANTEYLYAHRLEEDFMEDIIEEHFEFTFQQMVALHKYIEDEHEEVAEGL